MNLHKQVSVLVRGISEKYVPEPGRNDILSDALIGIRRFSNSCRWKEFWRLKKLEEIREKSNSSPKSVDCEGFFDSEVRIEAKKEGLGTNLRAKEKVKRAPRGSEDLEAFLSAVQRVIIDQVFEKRDMKDGGRKPNLHSDNLKNCCKNLRDTKTVVIPTDKTNSFRCIDIRDYKDWAIKHLLKNGKEIPRSKLIQTLDEAKELLEGLEDVMSEDEYYFVKSSLDSKAIPSPKLLIKDHKEINDDGNYPTRLVVPATNFTSAFSKLGYIGIKKIIDKAGINYTKKTIVQASHLKSQIESLKIRKDKHTIFSLDIEAFYPSVTYGLVKRAINFYSRTLGEEERATIDECLKMIAFGMGNTLLTFVDKYYEYDGEREIQDKGLTIGGYESAWLADLVAAFVLENSEDLFEGAVYDGIYRDDGLVILDGEKTNEEIGQGLETCEK